MQTIKNQYLFFLQILLPYIKLLNIRILQVVQKMAVQ